MRAKKKFSQGVYRFIAILSILGLAWAGFVWLTQAPPVDALPTLGLDDFSRVIAHKALRALAEEADKP